MGVVSKFVWYLLVLFEINGQVCKFTNIQIESEDGRQQNIELNVKKVDFGEKKSCPSCKSAKSKDFARSSSLFSDNWSISVPPSFSLIFTPGELIQECGMFFLIPATPYMTET